MFEKLLALVKKYPYNEEYLNDCLNALRNIFKQDVMKGMLCSARLKAVLKDHFKNKENTNTIYQTIQKVLIIETPYSLDSYFQALEWQRPLQERFYYPRRQQLLPIVRALEDLLIHDKLDELFISQPPRTGKTTLVMFAYTWIIGKNSETANLYVSCSGILTNAMYRGIYEIITDNYTYDWAKIWEGANFDKNSMCNSKETWLDTGRSKRYHSFTSRSIDGSLNGACDCNGLLGSDDLVTGIEEALNPERLGILNKKVNNDMLTRAKENCKRLWIGTRWSKADPIGVRIETLKNQVGIRFKIVNVPALNEKGESNFNYLFGVGFSTEYFRNKRQSFINVNDEASWLAQFQGEPIERSGLLFPQDKLTYWNGEFAEGTKIDRIFAPIDVAFGGGDYLSMPIIYKVGRKKYVMDVVYDARDKSYTKPQVVDKTIAHKIGTLRFEKNNGGDAYKDEVTKMLEERGYKCNIRAIPAPNNKAKEIKIFETAPDIIKDFVFLEPSKRSIEYQLFMTHLTSYTILGKKQRDDAPDSLSQAVLEDREMSLAEIEIFKRPF